MKTEGTLNATMFRSQHLDNKDQWLMVVEGCLIILHNGSDNAILQGGIQTLVSTLRSLKHTPPSNSEMLCVPELDPTFSIQSAVPRMNGLLLSGQGVEVFLDEDDIEALVNTLTAMEMVHNDSSKCSR